MILRKCLLAAILCTATTHAQNTCQSPDPNIGIDPINIEVSDHEVPNAPCNMMDNDFSSRWSAPGEHEAIFDLGAAKNFDQLRISYYLGNPRSYSFNIEISTNGTNWTAVGPTFQSSGTTTDFENYNLGVQNARYIKYLGHGNNVNYWNNITEFRILDTGSGSTNPDNFLSMDSWAIGNGTILGYTNNGADSENVRELGIGPHGDNTVLWKAVPDANNNADGGWETGYHTIDPNKTYRLSVWIKKTGNTNGITYFGMRSKNATDPYTTLRLDGSENINPYFWTGDLPELDKWYLLVGFVHPSGYTGTTSLGRIYDGATGERLVNINVTDYKFKPSAAQLLHRAYLYYNTDTANRQYFWGPTIHEVTDPESGIPELLNPPADGGTSGGSSQWADDANGINHNGNVGIGTNALSSYKLAVDGKVRSREVRVDADTWADYVFENGYKLPTLEEVEKHISEKGHLINIPSAEEVKANGIELGEMNKLLLEKIEELTLYILQQEERIKTLEDQRY